MKEAVRQLALVAVAIIYVASCSPAPEEAARVGGRPTSPDGPLPRRDDTEWVVTRETVGTTTTVTNVSGSKWGGVAVLEEELSIGVEAGEDPYMFGTLGAAWATDDLVYAVDIGVKAVRAFDADGNYVRDIGSEGMGPGEYQQPMDVAVTSDGRIFVLDRRKNGVIVYSKEGTYLEEWGWNSGTYSSGYMVLDSADTPWINTSVLVNPGGPLIGARRRAMQALGPEGRIGEPLLFPASNEHCAMYADNEIRNGLAVPFCANVVSALAPSEAVVTGDASEYRFEVRNPDGTTVVVRRQTDLVPVLDEERDFSERWATLRMRGWEPGWRWDGPPIPDTKPAFRSFTPDQSGRVLVRREGMGRLIDGCDQTPTAEQVREGSAQDCWESRSIWEMFDLDGDFLGEILFPDIRTYPPFFIKDDVFYLGVMDDYGTQFLRRYRLVLPTEDAQ
jgi:hypothetical protein